MSNDLVSSCRVLYAIGSLDYLWHKLVRTCNLPLGIPLGADSATLSGQELQAIVVNALKLDHNWRNPDAHIQRAIPIIPDANTSPVDSMHLLPGGKWLFTTHFICSHSRQYTDLILWCLDDMTSPRSIITIPIDGRFPVCRAYYQPAQHKFTVAVSSEKDDSTESVEVYHISLDNPAVVTHSESLAIQPVASDGSLLCVYNIGNLRICGDILGATYHQYTMDNVRPCIDAVHIYLRNLVTGATATFKACDGNAHHDQIAFELFRNQYALGCAAPDTFLAHIVSFYDIPPSIISTDLDSAPNSDPNTLEGILSARCRLSHSVWFLYRASSSNLENGIPILNTMTFSGSSWEVIIDRFSPLDHETRFISCPTIASQSSSTHAIMGDHRQLGETGRRAVWVDMGGDMGGEMMLRKWSASRYRRGKELLAGASVLMPSKSGLPFTLGDICGIAFDEASCRLCVSLYNGELYVCDFL
ncbi:hypothetical protein BJ138DRAFT_1184539 [Hygrophoropsis aurantiaca]|uniref:Uncharacterized protein n=1 Tax=Hygrophoropsis aurantiaca TaxID=72124 RepID=A0ACB7ZRB6_9AGAM|nr:hypothetical protein BJ138DRAFT_1184539 [Hygrophoropsis aurantiaca]